MALNLGTLIADGYIAVEAHDGQQVKNVGKDVLALAKKLSVSQSVLARSASITQFAENDAWDQLNEELEATQNEVKKRWRRIATPILSPWSASEVGYAERKW